MFYLGMPPPNIAELSEAGQLGEVTYGSAVPSGYPTRGGTVVVAGAGVSRPSVSLLDVQRPAAMGPPDPRNLVPILGFARASPVVTYKAIQPTELVKLVGNKTVFVDTFKYPVAKLQIQPKYAAPVGSAAALFQSQYESTGSAGTSAPTITGAVTSSGVQPGLHYETKGDR